MKNKQIAVRLNDPKSTKKVAELIKHATALLLSDTSEIDLTKVAISTLEELTNIHNEEISNVVYTKLLDNCSPEAFFDVLKESPKIANHFFRFANHNLIYSVLFKNMSEPRLDYSGLEALKQIILNISPFAVNQFEKKVGVRLQLMQKFGRHIFYNYYKGMLYLRGENALDNPSSVIQAFCNYSLKEDKRIQAKTQL